MSPREKEELKIENEGKELLRLIAMLDNHNNKKTKIAT